MPIQLKPHDTKPTVSVDYMEIIDSKDSIIASGLFFVLLSIAKILAPTEIVDLMRLVMMATFTVSGILLINKTKERGRKRSI